MGSIVSKKRINEINPKRIHTLTHDREIFIVSGGVIAASNLNGDINTNMSTTTEFVYLPNYNNCSKSLLHSKNKSNKPSSTLPSSTSDLIESKKLKTSDLKETKNDLTNSDLLMISETSASNFEKGYIFIQPSYENPSNGKFIYFVDPA